MASSAIYPETEWVLISPDDAGFDAKKLDDVKGRLDDRVADGRYRVVIVHSGHLVAEWNHGFGPKKRLSPTTAIKALFSRAFGRSIEPFSSEKNKTLARNRHLPLASAAKSVFSCILGIAIHEGKIPSAVAK